MVRAVIFDMDGLLIDSEPLWQVAEKVVFAKLGIELNDKMCEETIGYRVDEMVEYWYRHKPWEAVSRKEAETEIVDTVIELINERAEPLEGVDYIMHYFKEKNIPVALASSSPVRLIEAVLTKFKIRHHFKTIHSAEHEEYGKPHPAVYLTTSKKLQVPPACCLAFEDSFNGLLAAKSAKMKTVSIPEKSVWSKSRFDIADFKLNSLQEFNDNHFKYLNQLI